MNISHLDMTGLKKLADTGLIAPQEAGESFTQILDGVAPASDLPFEGPGTEALAQGPTSEVKQASVEGAVKNILFFTQDKGAKSSPGTPAASNEEGPAFTETENNRGEEVEKGEQGFDGLEYLSLVPSAAFQMARPASAETDEGNTNTSSIELDEETSPDPSGMTLGTEQVAAGSHGASNRATAPVVPAKSAEGPVVPEQDGLRVSEYSRGTDKAPNEETLDKGSLTGTTLNEGSRRVARPLKSPSDTEDAACAPVGQEAHVGEKASVKDDGRESSPIEKNEWVASNVTSDASFQNKHPEAASSVNANADEVAKWSVKNENDGASPEEVNVPFITDKETDRGLTRQALGDTRNTNSASANRQTTEVKRKDGPRVPVGGPKMAMTLAAAPGIEKQALAFVEKIETSGEGSFSGPFTLTSVPTEVEKSSQRGFTGEDEPNASVTGLATDAPQKKNEEHAEIFSEVETDSRPSGSDNEIHLGPQKKRVDDWLESRTEKNAAGDFSTKTLETGSGEKASTDNGDPSMEEIPAVTVQAGKSGGLYAGSDRDDKISPRAKGSKTVEGSPAIEGSSPFTDLTDKKIATGQTGSGGEDFSGSSRKEEKTEFAARVDSSRNSAPLTGLSGNDAFTVKSAPEVKGVEQAPRVNEIFEKLNAGIKVSLAHGGGEVRLTLNPDHLGTMRINIKIEDAVVRAHITVEHSAVKAMLDSDAFRVREIFQQQGLTLDKYSVDIGGQGSFSSDSHTQGGWARGESYRQEDRGYWREDNQFMKKAPAGEGPLSRSDVPARPGNGVDLFI